MTFISLAMKAILLLGIASLVLNLFAPMSPRIALALCGIALAGCVVYILTQPSSELKNYRPGAVITKITWALVAALGITAAALVFQGEVPGVPVRKTGLLLEEPPYQLQNGDKIRSTSKSYFFTTSLFMLLGTTVPCICSLMLLEFQSMKISGTD